MKRVLITGGTGFVGANLARRTLCDGHETHLLVREGHQGWRIDDIADDVRLHPGSVEDASAVRRAVTGAKPDWVFHLAAYGAYPSQTGMERMAAVNLMGSVTLLDVCSQLGVESFVQTGSSSEYGYTDHPAAEIDLLEPNSHYAITKAAATHYCQLVSRRTGMHAVTARLYSIYGPFEEPTRLLPTLIVKGLHGQLPPLVSPATGRDFVYVDDAVDALLRIAATPGIAGGSVFNVCSGRQTTIQTVVATARRLLQVPVEPAWSTMDARSWDTSVWIGSPTAVERATGWKARRDLEAGMELMIAWFRANPRWPGYYESRLAG